MCLKTAMLMPGSGSEEEIEKLRAKVGELTMEKDFLSKALGRDR